MKYLGRTILTRIEEGWHHRHDNCGEVPSIYYENIYYRIKGSNKEFLTLKDVKAYVRLLNERKLLKSYKKGKL